jgi:exocyst complex component 4
LYIPQEWFAAHIQELANVITRSGASESLLALPESNVQTLLELAKDFEDLADTCLLVLHLEVRVHCFYHLVPLGRQAQFWLNGDNQEPDPEIGRLSRDLTAIDESLSAFIQPRKHRVRSLKMKFNLLKLTFFCFCRILVHFRGS